MGEDDEKRKWEISKNGRKETFGVKMEKKSGRMSDYGGSSVLL